MYAQRIFPAHNGRVIDLTDLELKDCVLALLSVAFADYNPKSDENPHDEDNPQKVNQTFNFLKLQSNYQNEPEHVQDLLNYTLPHMLAAFEEKYLQGFVTHLVFVMFWAMQNDDIADKGLNKAYFLTQTILEKEYGVSFHQKTIKKYFKLQRHATHIWVAVYSYPSTERIAKRLLQKENVFQQYTEFKTFMNELTLPRFVIDAASFYFYGTEVALPRSTEKTDRKHLLDRRYARSIIGVSMVQLSPLIVNEEFKKFYSEYKYTER